MIQEVNSSQLVLLLTLLFVAFLSLGCWQDQDPNLIFVEKGSILSVKTDGRECKLCDDGIAYEAYPSPSGRLIAVETMVMSDLTLLRLFKKSGSCYVEIHPRLPEALWQMASRQHGFNVEEVEHPRMRFLGWLGEEGLIVELSGIIKGRKHIFRVTYPLDGPGIN